jgi:uncharacterized protein involved in exopolysaccharide biosynthesis
MQKPGCITLIILAIIGPFLGFTAASIYNNLAPKKFESEAIIEVKPTPEIRLGAGSNNPSTRPQFLATQLEIIRSKDSLRKVSTNLELTNHWGVDEETAIKLLKAQLLCQILKGTDLIAIRVRSTSARSAMEIADQVARTYRETRASLHHDQFEKALTELDKLIHDQEDKVEERRKLLSAYVTKGPMPPEESDHASYASYLAAKDEFEAENDLLTQMKLKKAGLTLDHSSAPQPVIIHQQAEQPRHPASPNIKLNLLLGTASSLILLPLAGLLVLGLIALLRR